LRGGGGEAGDGGDYGVEEGDVLSCHSRFEPHLEREKERGERRREEERVMQFG
jgi:hypothetical protein